MNGLQQAVDRVNAAVKGSPEWEQALSEVARLTEAERARAEVQRLHEYACWLKRVNAPDNVDDSLGEVLRLAFHKSTKETDAALRAVFEAAEEQKKPDKSELITAMFAGLDALNEFDQLRSDGQVFSRRWFEVEAEFEAAREEAKRYYAEHDAAVRRPSVPVTVRSALAVIEEKFGWGVRYRLARLVGER